MLRFGETGFVAHRWRIVVQAIPRLQTQATRLKRYLLTPRGHLRGNPSRRDAHPPAADDVPRLLQRSCHLYRLGQHRQPAFHRHLHHDRRADVWREWRHSWRLALVAVATAASRWWLWRQSRLWRRWRDFQRLHQLSSGTPYLFGALVFVYNHFLVNFWHSSLDALVGQDGIGPFLAKIPLLIADIAAIALLTGRRASGTHSGLPCSSPSRMPSRPQCCITVPPGARQMDSSRCQC